MEKEIISRMYRIADTELAKARNELNRSEENVVLYSSCISARSAMYHYLGCLSMLDRENVDIDSINNGTKPMDQLIKEAGKRYPEVANMDFSAVQCRRSDIASLLSNDEVDFCNNTDNVNNCTNLAYRLKEIVMKRAPAFVQP